MPRFTALASLATLLLASQQVLGAAVKKPTSTLPLPPLSTATATEPGATPTATLDPVLPPDLNPSEITILKPAAQVDLAFAGNVATDAKSGNLRKRRAAHYILLQSETTFTKASVPLDHSSYIKHVACTSENDISGTFTTANVFNYAKSQWANVTDLILISSATSCGATSAGNVYFEVNKFTFDQSSLSFTATGSSVRLGNVLARASVHYGTTSPSKLQRRSASGHIYRRDNYTESDSWTFDGLLADQEGYSVDSSAPWQDAVLLESWNSDGSESDDPNGASVGLNLYCIDCGASLTLTISGTCIYSWIPPEIDSVTATFSASMYAGMFLGLDMKAEYTQTWSDTFFNQAITPFGVEDIVTIGPLITMGLSASIDISAEGQLFIGASATWDALEMNVDILNPGSYSVTGNDPVLNQTASAELDLSATATLGLPIGLGIGIDVGPDGYWSWSLGITDTPAIQASAEFSASASTSGGTSVGDGDCPGVDWGIDLLNEIDFYVQDVTTIPLTSWDTQLLGGCITISTPSPSSTPTATPTPSSTPTATPSPSSTPTATPQPSSPPTSTPTGGSPTTTPTTTPTGKTTKTKKTKSTGTKKTTTTTTPTTTPTTKKTTSTPTTKKTTSTPTTKKTTSTPTHKPTTTTKKTTSTHTTVHTPTSTHLCSKKKPGVPFNANCHQSGCGLKGNIDRIAKSKQSNSATCAGQCLSTSNCLSFGYNSTTTICHLFNIPFAELAPHFNPCESGQDAITYLNPACFVKSAC